MDKTEDVVFNPRLARELLKVNTINRPLTRSIVDGWKAIFERGEYIKTHQGIAISDTGLMLDGQHRCVAMSEMPEDFSVPMKITRGLPEAAFRAMDIGRKRTQAEVLHENPRLVEVARFLARLYLGRTNEVTPPYLMRFVRIIRSEHDSLMAFCGNACKMWSSAPVRAAAVISILSGQNEDFVHIVYRSLVASDFETMTTAAQTLYKAHVSGSLRATNAIDAFTKSMKVFDVRQQNLKVIKVLDSAAAVGLVREFLHELLGEAEEKKKAPQSRTPSRSIAGAKFIAVRA